MAGTTFPPFDPELFRTEGHALVDRLADYLAQATSGDPALPVLPWTDPDALAASWPADFDTRGDLAELTERVLAQSNHLHHPRYLGHQVTSPLPLAGLAGLLDGVLNNANAVYEMGPVVTSMERNLARWFGGRLGWDEHCDGFLTSGGSLGNLTCLLAARQAKAGFDVWGEGLQAGPPLAILAAETAHYSVVRATRVMGLGHDGVITVPVDSDFRLRPECLAAALGRAEALGRRVIAVSAAACCTATGSFDPLEPLADFCAEHDLWLHVDGAHGAAAALSADERWRLAGIERADSVVCDAHKMLLTPALCTLALFRDGLRSYQAFAQEASYLLHKRDPREEWYNLCGRTFECTKTMMALKLWTALSVHGPDTLGDYVHSRFALGRRFGELVAAEADFELPVAPQCNIVCFRWVPGGEVDSDALQPAIRQRLLDDGSFHIVQTRLPSGIYLRVTIINPLTSESDLVALLDAVRAAGRSILGRS